MTKEKILKILNHTPISKSSFTIIYENSQPIYGFFENFNDSAELEIQNKWRFVENKNAQIFKKSPSIELTIILDGDLIEDIISN